MNHKTLEDSIHFLSFPTRRSSDLQDDADVRVATDTIALRSQDAQRFQIAVRLHRTGDTTESPTVRKDRKSTRLNSSHSQISYADFCLKKINEKTVEDSIHFFECFA